LQEQAQLRELAPVHWQRQEQEPVREQVFQQQEPVQVLSFFASYN
jgi:hypothetical protein